jgi:hypothetical protein
MPPKKNEVIEIEEGVPEATFATKHTTHVASGVPRVSLGVIIYLMRV